MRPCVSVRAGVWCRWEADEPACPCFCVMFTLFSFFSVCPSPYPLSFFCCDIVELGTYGKLKYYHSMTEEGKPRKFSLLNYLSQLRPFDFPPLLAIIKQHLHAFLFLLNYYLVWFASVILFFFFFFTVSAFFEFENLSEISLT